jgi:hypothetical protein
VYSEADRVVLYSVKEYYMTKLEASLIVALTICYHVIELEASLIVTLTICYHVIECDIV